MARVLLAASQDWIGTARLPLTLSSAGISVDVIAPSDAAVMSSSRVRTATAVSGGPRAVAEKALQLAPGYDRVIPCDDPLLQELVELDDPGVDAFLPAPRPAMAILTDKTRFPRAARAAGIPVPRSVTAVDLTAVRESAAELGSVVLKGTYGFGGSSVRVADSAQAAEEAARELGLPVLVQELLVDECGLMACLYERGRLVGALAAQKRQMMFPRGPSSVVVPWSIDDRLLDIGQRGGAHFELHGFVSYDVFRNRDTGAVRVLEINLRPVGTLQLGRRMGVDMGGLLLGVLGGQIADEPALSRAGRAAPLFPQEMMRLKNRHGQTAGTVRWLVTPRALSEVPWGDAGLSARWWNKSL
jgi:hypothetical protein